MENDLFDTIMKSFLHKWTYLKISKIISEHGNEEKVSEDSIVTGLVYRLMNPMDNEDMEESIKTAKNIWNPLSKWIWRWRWRLWRNYRRFKNQKSKTKYM